MKLIVLLLAVFLMSGCLNSPYAYQDEINAYAGKELRNVIAVFGEPNELLLARDSGRVIYSYKKVRYSGGGGFDIDGNLARSPTHVDYCYTNFFLDAYNKAEITDDTLVLGSTHSGNKCKEVLLWEHEVFK